MPKTISEERLRELEAPCRFCGGKDGCGFCDGYLMDTMPKIEELRALIAGYRGYRNCIANIEHAQANGMVMCRMDILRDTLEAFQETGDAEHGN